MLGLDRASVRVISHDLPDNNGIQIAHPPQPA